MSDQNRFTVIFDAENQLSAQIRVITGELQGLRAVAEATAKPIVRITNSLEKLASIDYSTAKTGLSSINRQLKTMGEMNIDGIKSMFDTLRSAKFGNVASQLERIAKASKDVSDSTQNATIQAGIAQRTTTQYSQPQMPATAGGFGGGGGFHGGWSRNNLPPMMFAPDTGGARSGYASGVASTSIAKVENDAKKAATAIDGVEKQSEEATQAVDNLTESVHDVEKAFSRANKEIVKYNNNLSNLTSSTNAVTGNLGTIIRPSSVSGTNVANTGIGVAGVAQTLAPQIAMSSTFNWQQMLSDTQSQLAQLQQQAKQLKQTTGQVPKDIQLLIKQYKRQIKDIQQIIATANKPYAVGIQVKLKPQSIAQQISGQIQRAVNIAGNRLNAGGGIFARIFGGAGGAGASGAGAGGNIIQQIINRVTGAGAGAGGAGGAGGIGGAGGGVGGRAGGAVAGGGALKIPQFVKNAMQIISIYNSVVFALGTMVMAFDSLSQSISEANEVTKTMATIQAVAAQEGVYKLDSATERYSNTMRVAIGNQIMFGDSLKNNLNAMLKFQQIATASGVSVRQLNDIVQLLALRDPVQGIEGATIAIQELMSGDPVSLRRRFELPAGEINAIAKESGNADLQIRMLTQTLAKQGITTDALNARLDTTARAYDQLAATASNTGTIFNQALARTFEDTAGWLDKTFAIISAGGYKNLDVSNEGAIRRWWYKTINAQVLASKGGWDNYFHTQQENTQNLTDLQRELQSAYVEQGIIVDTNIQKNQEYGRAYQDLVRAYENGNNALEKQKALLLAIHTAGMQKGYAVAPTAEELATQQQSIASTTKQNATTMLLTAATQAYADGNVRAAQTLATLLQIREEDGRSAVQIAQELIDAQITQNSVTQEGANAIFGISNAYRDLIQSQIESIKQTNRQAEIDQYMIDLANRIVDGNFELTDVISQLAKQFNITNKFAIDYLDTLYEVNTLMPKVIGNIGLMGDYINMHQSMFSSDQLRDAVRKWLEKQNKDLEDGGSKSASIAKNNNDQLLKIEKDAMAALVAFDEEMYRKRIRALQAFYSETVLMQQKRQYEMTANNMDLVEGRNSKLDLEDKRRLLARENIEAYGALQMNEAIKKANQFALNGNASFAKEYLNIQQDRISETESLQWKLHDTMVRLEGDSEAQKRARAIYDESIGYLETYYDTRVGLAEAAARDEQEADRKQRRAIIEDAISAAMELTDVDENKRQNIIDNLTIAGQSITDLSTRYVDGVDAMRGSLELLAKAMRDVRDSANILTPEQLAAFNNLPSGIGGGGGGAGVEVNNNTQVNVGGITVNVTSQANPDEIARMVVETLKRETGARSY